MIGKIDGVGSGVGVADVGLGTGVAAKALGVGDAAPEVAADGLASLPDPVVDPLHAASQRAATIISTADGTRLMRVLR